MSHTFICTCKVIKKVFWESKISEIGLWYQKEILESWGSAELLELWGSAEPYNARPRVLIQNTRPSFFDHKARPSLIRLGWVFWFKTLGRASLITRLGRALWGSAVCLIQNPRPSFLSQDSRPRVYDARPSVLINKFTDQKCKTPGRAS